MNQKLTVFITGASGVIGREIAREFLKSGWNVIAGYLTNNLFDSDPSVHSVKIDVADVESVKSVFKKIDQTYGRLDVLINAAAVVVDKLVANMAEEDWDRVLDVNLKGVKNCSREAIGIMERQGGGHIMNFSSVSALAGRVGQANYAASKAAVIGFSQSLAREVGRLNIRVNIILPGIIFSEMTDKLHKEQLNRLIGENVLLRTTTAEEIARFCLFLASTQNISGKIFQLDSRIQRWT
ncbi:MAG: SDR family NAD(P)-dependent oxidoreductase [Verrucomicrobiia bacterium]